VTRALAKVSPEDGDPERTRMLEAAVSLSLLGAALLDRLVGHIQLPAPKVLSRLPFILLVHMAKDQDETSHDLAPEDARGRSQSFLLVVRYDGGPMARTLDNPLADDGTKGPRLKLAEISLQRVPGKAMEEKR